MSEHIILVRLNTGRVVALMNDDGENLAVFKNLDDAVECAEQHSLCQAFPFQIVELNEL